MSRRRLAYAVVTPARNEADNLHRLARCLAEQTLPPAEWVIVDNGSTDETAAVAADLAAELPYAIATHLPGEERAVRGGPVVRAFARGVALLEQRVDVIVKLDSDLTFDADYFARLVGAFAADPDLGIASGVCHELDGGEWSPLHGTRDHVWGASRAYRVACLHAVSPLEERQGWDEVDAIKARLRGWRVGTLRDLPFRHHRPEGMRDGSRRRWLDQGETAYFMGYRFSYLLLRALFNARRDRAALRLVGGYLSAALRRSQRLPDSDARAWLRREQQLRRLPLRAAEALGRSHGVS